MTKTRPLPAGSSCALPTTAWASHPEELGQIFELYKQAGQSANRRYRGTGLGLAVVRDLTELHGGTVAVESRVKEGSTFTVRIPYAPVIEEEDEES